MVYPFMDRLMLRRKIPKWLQLIMYNYTFFFRINISFLFFNKHYLAAIIAEKIINFSGFK